jgi:hypothetical protein
MKEESDVQAKISLVAHWSTPCHGSNLEAWKWLGRKTACIPHNVKKLVTEMDHAWLVVLMIETRFPRKGPKLCQSEIPHTEERKIPLGRCCCLEKVDKIGVAGGTVVAEP